MIEVYITLLDCTPPSAFVEVVGANNTQHLSAVIIEVLRTLPGLDRASLKARPGSPHRNAGRVIKATDIPTRTYCDWKDENTRRTVERSIATELEARATTLPKAG